MLLSRVLMQIICLGFIILFSIPSFAVDKTEDYDADYLLDEGRLMFKARAFYVNTSPKQSGLPASTISNPNRVPSLTKMAFGGDTATTIFFSDHIGVEASLGVQMMRIKSNALNAVAANYGSGATVTGKPKYLFGVPLGATMQFHVAPFGGIRPYVGAGYHFVYFVSKVNQIKINNGHGPVAQVGIDFVAKDDTLITLDVRQYLMKTKIKYKDTFVGSEGISSTVKFNPLVFSVGVGFKL
jgi:outer membrane protein